MFSPSAPKVCQVLALLLLRANHVVGVDAITEELWGDMPPQSAMTTTQTYVYQLRRMFRRIEAGNDGPPVIVTRTPGYLLQIEPHQIDANEFAQSVEIGRDLLQQRRPAEARRHLNDALALWRGRALSNVNYGRLLEAHAAYLDEEKISALALRIQCDLQLGRQAELISELREIVSAYPFNEWFHAQLIDALYRTGRRGEALRAYQNLRQLLGSELGLEPSVELQRLQFDMLNGGQRLVSRRRDAAALAAPVPGELVNRYRSAS